MAVPECVPSYPDSSFKLSSTFRIAPGKFKLPQPLAKNEKVGRQSMSVLQFLITIDFAAFNNGTKSLHWLHFFAFLQLRA
jgi:hypothetical protein